MSRRYHLIKLVLLCALLASRLAFVAVSGCDSKRDPVRELVEHDASGSAAAIAACQRRQNLPAEACRAVAMRAADHVLLLAPPSRLDCEDAIELAERLAPERLHALAGNCCRGELGKQLADVCTRIGSK
jgi:hypothetical protein